MFRIGTADDDDGYFADGSKGDSKAKRLVTAWTRDAVSMSNSYIGAVGLLKEGRKGGDEVDVVLNACTTHLRDINHNIVQWGHGKKDDLEMDR